MAVRAYLVGALFVLLTYRIVQAQWSGQYYHMRDDPDYYEVGYVCRFWFFWCWSWRTVWYVRYNPVYRCCPGWSHNGNRNCNVPVCNPRCMNGGTCRGASSPNCFKFRGYCSCSPNTCSCPAGSFGVDCANTSCSHLAPCYPGNCVNTNGCRCAGGFKSNSSSLKQHCLNIDYDQNGNNDLKIYQMQVRLSYWPRGKNPPEEKYRLLTDSTRLKENEMDFQWTNQKDFNRLETTCSSQFFTQDLPPKPRYIGRTVMGVVKAEAKIELSKRPAHSERHRFYSLNATVPCPTNVSLLKPEPGLYECNISNPNFDRFLEHGDFLKVTYVTQGGGFRELLVLNIWGESPIENQTFTGGTKEQSVEFRFDFEAPHHCAEKKTCQGKKSILKVPEITKTSPLRISWTGWQDDDSGVYRYAMEVFKMTKGPDGDLEIKPTEALNPLIIRELYASNLTAQQYEPPEPGMYSILLEVADHANNTKYARRLCLYDSTSAITNDPDHDLFVRSASEAANYSYQSDKAAPILVTWDKHFRNAFHEDNNLLGPVRPYPPSLEGHKKNIPQTTELEDLQGEITINGVRNVRGIVMFRVAYTKDHDGGLKQPDQPPGPWKDLDLVTDFKVPLIPSEGDTVTIWVKATDAMGNEKRERTKVTFDSTPPNVQDPVFKMNNIVPGISFSSTFEIIANDDKSGIAYIQWTFKRQNGTIIHQEKVPGKRATKEECQKDFRKCRCTPTDECFWFDQSYSFSNCHMMVEKENLETEVITVTADVTNMAGIVTSMSLTKSNLTMLNGTEAYFPLQNLKVVSITDTSVALTWDLPPSCFKREELWVIVGDKKLKVHKDINQFDLSGLASNTSYAIYMQTVYEGCVRSDTQPLVIFTDLSLISEQLMGSVEMDLRHSHSLLTNVTFVRNIVSILSQIMDENVTVLSDANMGYRLLSAIDAVGREGLLNTRDHFLTIAPNLAIAVHLVNGSSFTGLVLTAHAREGNRFQQDEVRVSTDITDVQTVPEVSSLKLPASLLTSIKNESRIVTAVHTSGKIFEAIEKARLNVTWNETVSELNADNVTKVNSYIMAASVVGHEVMNLRDTVKINFVHIDKNADNPRCVFWNTSAEEGRSAWSTAGCRRVDEASTDTRTLCECNHLTNFALLMDVYQTSDTVPTLHLHVLSIISYIGCGVSLLTFTLTILTYCIWNPTSSAKSGNEHKGHRRRTNFNKPTMILLNLCTTMALSNLVFVAGVQSYTMRHHWACKVMALLLHLCLLSSLCWMAVEAFYMYLTLVRVFGTRVTRIMLKGSAFAWGLPVLVVIVTAAVDMDNYASLSSGVCWLSGIAFYAAFVAPVGLILVFNSVIFTMVLRVILTLADNRLDKRRSSKAVTQLRRAVGVVILLGLTWVFGFLAIDEASLLFNYLFAVFNSFQGLFVFLFYCVLNAEVRAAWKQSCGQGRGGQNQSEKVLPKRTAAERKKLQSHIDVKVTRSTIPRDRFAGKATSSGETGLTSLDDGTEVALTTFSITTKDRNDDNQ